MPVVSNDFSDIVYNRRSIRNFDPSVKIPREELLEILDKTVTAPSSVNMQPWRFVVVDDNCSIVIEANRAAILAANLIARAYDDRFHDRLPLDVASRAGVFHTRDDNVANARITAARSAQNLNAQN